MICQDALGAMDAYLDGELTVLEVLRVEHHLAQCASCRHVMESEAALHALLEADGMDEVPPVSLLERILHQVRAERAAHDVGRPVPGPLPRFNTRLAWGGLIALLLVALGLPNTHGPAETPFLADVMARHLQYTATDPPDLEFMTPDAPRLMGWLRHRVGFAVTAPAVASGGEQLVGGRVDSVGDRPAAYLLYEGEGGKRISLFITRRWSHPAEKGTEEEIEGNEIYTTTLEGVNLAWWTDRGRLYVALAREGAADLKGLAMLCLRRQRAAVTTSRATPALLGALPSPTPATAALTDGGLDPGTASQVPSNGHYQTREGRWERRDA
jgi:anti-sigma factor RsiW